jgi:hypothetical protein
MLSKRSPGMTGLSVRRSLGEDIDTPIGSDGAQ